MGKMCKHPLRLNSTNKTQVLLDIQGWAKVVYGCSYGKRHAGYDYNDSSINSKECHNDTVNLLLSTPVCISITHHVLRMPNFTNHWDYKNTKRKIQTAIIHSIMVSDNLKITTIPVLLFNLSLLIPRRKNNLAFLNWVWKTVLILAWFWVKLLGHFEDLL